jgi:hypothetical protein
VQPSQSTLYSVTVTAANGCSTAKSVSITVIVPIGLTAPAKVCVKAAPPLKTVVTLPIIMQLSGGSAPYTYSWSYKAPSSTVYKAIPSGGTSIGKVSFVPVAGKATLNLIGTKGNLNGLQGYIVRLTVKDQTYTASAQTLLDGSCTLGSSPARQGVFEAEQVRVRVYPNPVGEVLLVEIRGLGQPAKVSLYDLQGRQRGYWSVAPLAGSGQLKAPVGGLANGLYLLQVETAEGVLIRQRVLKLR